MIKPSELNEEQVNSLIQDYRDGMKIKSIAEKYDLTPSGVNYILTFNQVERSHPSRQKTVVIPDEVAEQIITLYNEGLSGRKIAEKIGISYPHVYCVLRQHKIPAHERVTPEETANGIVQDYAAGIKVKDIRQKYNVTETVLYSVLARYGYKERRMRPTHLPDRKEAKAIIKDYDEKMPINDILKKHNLSVCVLYSILRENNVEYRYKNLSADDKELIIADYKRGMTKKEICKAYRINYSQLSACLKGIEHKKPALNKRTNLSEKTTKKLISDYEKGMTIKEIMDKYCLSSTVIYRVLRENNVTKRQDDKSKRHAKRKKYNLSRSESAKIIDEYLQGVPVKQICSDYEIPPYVIYTELEQAGINPGRNKSSVRALTPKEAQKLQIDYCKGISLNKLASKYGLPVTHVRNKLISRGMHV